MPAATSEQQLTETRETDPINHERLLQGVDTALQTWQHREPPLPVLQERNISQIKAFMDNPYAHNLFLEADPGTGKTIGALTTAFRELLRNNKNGKMLVTQPRRIAAQSQAEFIGNTISRGDDELKRAVDYYYKDKPPGKHSRIDFTVEMSLLLALVKDKTLSKYDAVFLDEVHGIKLRLLMPLLRLAQREREKQGRPLKIIFATGTADTVKDDIVTYFDHTKLMKVEGKKFKSKEEYEPEYKEEVTTGNFVDRAIERTKDILTKNIFPHPEQKGDMLIFMPTRATIKQTSEALQDWINQLVAQEKLQGRKVEIIPLVGGEEGKANYAKIHEERDPSSNTLRIYIATNVAEEAITIEGIAHVLVSGFRRVKIKDPETGIITSRLLPISQSSIRQQAGRERTGKGNVYYLFKESQLKWFPRVDEDPEDYAEEIMTLKMIGIDDVRNFPWVHPPNKDAFEAGIAALQQLGILDKNERLNKELAEAMDKYQTGDLRYDRMLAEADMIEDEAQRKQCKEALSVIIGLLSNEGSVYVPRFKPDESFKAKYMPEGTTSDFQVVLRLWNDYVKKEKINGINTSVFASAGQMRVEFLDDRKLRNSPVDLSGETLNNLETCLYTGLAGQELEHSKNGLYHRVNGKAHGIKLAETSVLADKEIPRVLTAKLLNLSRRVIAEFNMAVDPEKATQVEDLEKEAEKNLIQQEDAAREEATRDAISQEASSERNVSTSESNSSEPGSPTITSARPQGSIEPTEVPRGFFARTWVEIKDFFRMLKEWWQELLRKKRKKR